MKIRRTTATLALLAALPLGLAACGSSTGSGSTASSSSATTPMATSSSGTMSSSSTTAPMAMAKPLSRLPLLTKLTQKKPSSMRAQ